MSKLHVLDHRYHTRCHENVQSPIHDPLKSSDITISNAISNSVI